MNHASIVDGCLSTRATFVRFRRNDLAHLEQRLQTADPAHRKLVVVDAVFSMEGDLIDLPSLSSLCKRYNALLMVDEAHSLGILGDTGHGIEEHFGLPAGTIDIKMGTLSKTIPSVGGYIAGSAELIQFLKHTARGFVYSAAPPPSIAAAALKALEIIEQEPDRVRRLQDNYRYFLDRLRKKGFDVLQSQTAIVPILCGTEEKAGLLAGYCMENGIFIQPVIPPVVPKGTARLRATVTAGHTFEDIDYFVEVLERGAVQPGIL